MNALACNPAVTIARVEPLMSTRAVRGPFDYRLRGDQADVGVGALLRVPFGARSTLGVVVDLAAESEVPPERLVEPEAVLPGGLPTDLVELARWLAREYCSTPARALSLLLVPGAGARGRAKKVLVAEITDAGRAALSGAVALNDAQRTLLATLERDGPSLAARLGTPALRRLERRGLVSVVQRTRARRPRHLADRR